MNSLSARELYMLRKLREIHEFSFYIAGDKHDIINAMLSIREISGKFIATDDETEKIIKEMGDRIRLERGWPIQK